MKVSSLSVDDVTDMMWHKMFSCIAKVSKEIVREFLAIRLHTTECWNQEVYKVIKLKMITHKVCEITKNLKI